MKSPKIIVLHPFLLAAYPVIALLAYNIEEIKISDGIRALVISLLASVILFSLLTLVTRSMHKAALITTLTVILFCSYGHIYHFIRQEFTFGALIGRHRLLMPVYLAVMILGILWVTIKSRPNQTIHQFLNMFSIIALIFPIFQIAGYSIRSRSSANPASLAVADSTLHLPINQPAPDIYYIILDAYSRDDVLKKFYKIDNSAFLNELSKSGFFLARCSMSNYAQTQLSLVSSLNMNYLDALSDQYRPGNTSRVGLSELIKHNKVRQDLKGLGYTIYAFETGFKTTEWDDADYYLSQQSKVFSILQFGGGITDFELMIMRNSAILLIEDGVLILPRFIQPDFENPLRIHRDRILFVLSKLENLAKTPGPKFVFAHLVIPHPPYVFAPNGDFTNYDVPDDPGYKNQVAYIDQQIIALTNKLIANSNTPPIIVIQADHGGINTPPDGRTKILNAYYLPNDGNKLLYPNITPVNTFRIILDYYFSGKYDLLKDVSYFSVYQRPYEYSVIDERRPDCPAK